MEKVPSKARRRLLAGASGFALINGSMISRAVAEAVGSAGALGFAELPDGTLAEQLLYALPGKVPLIKKTFRPPNFETPATNLRLSICISSPEGSYRRNRESFRLSVRPLKARRFLFGQ